MKKSAIFVNTSRGPVVDQDALYKALKDGKYLTPFSILFCKSLILFSFVFLFFFSIR